MADTPEMPHTQTSAPVKSPETTEDPAGRRAPDAAPPRHAGAEGELHGDEMPAGADEPGAGL